jgi:hypothetical protein
MPNGEYAVNGAPQYDSRDSARPCIYAEIARHQCASSRRDHRAADSFCYKDQWKVRPPAAQPSPMAPEDVDKSLSPDELMDCARTEYHTTT